MGKEGITPEILKDKVFQRTEITDTTLQELSMMKAKPGS